MFSFVFNDEPIRHKTIRLLGMEEKYNLVLLRAGITTFGDLIKNWDNLGEIRNMGAKKMANIRAAFFAYICQENLLINCEVR